MRFLSFLALPNASLGLKSIQEWRVHVLKGILRGVIVLWVIALLGGVRNALVTYQNESASTPNARLYSFWF
ncbi:MAG: hypothetical protein IPJ47_13940 [Anaerolineales bacterium]|nr:hypothetical protein [Anaerolineales bacterium]